MESLRLPMLLTAILLAFVARSAPALPDSIASADSVAAADLISVPASVTAAADSLKKDRNWWHLLKQGYFNPYDTTVYYPRFLNFCMKVYRWGDKTFNSYDKDYVVGTGKNWKVYLDNDTWFDSYAMNYDHHNPVWLTSDLYDVVGLHLAYMAVSVSYTLDMTNIIGNKPILHKKLGFQFNTARFSAEVHYAENTGGAYIRRFCGYRGGNIIRYPLRDMSMKQWGFDLYYFLNNRRYSQGAAYNFSKYQLRSAGSFIFGISVSNQDIHIDFSGLPVEMLAHFRYPMQRFDINYNDYCLIVGYGFNWVFAKNFVFNITAAPSFGFKHCMAGSLGAGNDLFSANIRGRSAVTYNIGDIFLSLSGRIDTHWYLNDAVSCFNAITSGSLTAGVRF